MTERSKALTQTNGTNGVTLAGYGSRDTVREMEERILAMIPGAGKYTAGERRALAQLAVAHNLNPFNGELWVIPGSGTIIGIKGLRKLAHNQIAAVGGNFWVDYQEVTDEEKRKRYRVAPGDLALAIVRTRVWHDADVEVFYRQNALVFVNSTRAELVARATDLLRACPPLLDVVHPDLLAFWMRRATRPVSTGQAVRQVGQSAGNALRRRLGR